MKSRPDMLMTRPPARSKKHSATNMVVDLPPPMIPPLHSHPRSEQRRAALDNSQSAGNTIWMGRYTLSHARALWLTVDTNGIAGEVFVEKRVA